MTIRHPEKLNPRERHAPRGMFLFQESRYVFPTKSVERDGSPAKKSFVIQNPVFSLTATIICSRSSSVGKYASKQLIISSFVAMIVSRSSQDIWVWGAETRAFCAEHSPQINRMSISSTNSRGRQIVSHFCALICHLLVGSSICRIPHHNNLSITPRHKYAASGYILREPHGNVYGTMIPYTFLYSRCHVINLGFFDFF